MYRHCCPLDEAWLLTLPIYLLYLLSRLLSVGQNLALLEAVSSCIHLKNKGGGVTTGSTVRLDQNQKWSLISTPNGPTEATRKVSSFSSEVHIFTQLKEGKRTYWACGQFILLMYRAFDVLLWFPFGGFLVIWKSLFKSRWGIWALTCGRHTAIFRNFTHWQNWADNYWPNRGNDSSLVAVWSC